MSFQNGWAALHLEMSDKVPRTEYSAETHWDLVAKVTGLSVNAQSDLLTKKSASAMFRKTWDYSYIWSTLTNHQIFGDRYTKMGHASYQSDGMDFSDEVTALFTEPEDALKLDLDEFYGMRKKKQLTAAYNQHYYSTKNTNPDCVSMTGIYVTLISGLLEILGWDMLLLCAGTDPKAFGALANRYAKWIGQYVEALADCDSPVVMIHDDIVWTSGAFIHPDFYRQFIFPNYRSMFAPLIERNKIILYTSDGDYTQFIDDIAACNVNGFVMEPYVDMQYIADTYGKTHSFTGNFDTRILLHGDKNDIEREMKRCMDIGKKYPGFFMAVGNHIPSNTPVDNALYYNELYEKYSSR